MGNPNRFTVSAIIPSTEEPPRVVVDSDGQLPSREYDPLEMTNEDALRKLGSLAFATDVYLKVDYGRSNGAFQTVAVDPDESVLTEGYAWVKPEEAGVTLLRVHKPAKGLYLRVRPLTGGPRTY